MKVAKDGEKSTYLVRPARLEDAAGIAHAHIESWKTTYAGILPDSVLEALSKERHTEMWRGILAAPGRDSVTLAACNPEGSVVGFASGGKERSGELGCDGELYAIYLLREAQRQGAGTLLVGHFVREMRSKGFRSMAVWVLDLNPARRFYEALGGRVIAQKSIERGGQMYLEVAFGWDELGTLARA